MGDALKKVQAGQRLEIPAETYNAFLDAVRAERARRHSIEQDAGDEFRQTGIVKVRNNTGARERFDILGLDTPIVDPGVNLPEFKNRPTFNGSTPTLPDRNHAGSSYTKMTPVVVPTAASRVSESTPADDSRTPAGSGAPAGATPKLPRLLTKARREGCRSKTVP